MTQTKAIAALVATAVLAGGGTATASHMITGKDIRNGSVAERDLSKGVKAKLNAPGPAGVRGPQGPVGPPGADGIDGVDGDPGLPGQDGSDGADGADGQDGERGPQGIQGERGPQGDPGPRGFPGQDGVSGHEIRSGDLFVTANEGRHTVGVDCLNADAPVGGGFRTQEGTPVIVSSYPEGTGWRVVFDAPAGVQIRPYVVCIDNA